MTISSDFLLNTVMLSIPGEPKIPQRENHDMSEMREYFCTKLCSVA